MRTSSYCCSIVCTLSLLVSATMPAISRARVVAVSSNSSSRLEKRCSRWSKSSVRASSVDTSASMVACRSAIDVVGACGCCCRAVRPPRASERPCEVNWSASSPRSCSTLVVTLLNVPRCCSTLAVVAPLLLLRSFMAATNSETRVAMVCSIEFMFSWAPLSTSCSRILASRSRSNSAVESERSMVCVSSMSATVAEAVCLDSSIARLGRAVQILERARDRQLGALR